MVRSKIEKLSKRECEALNKYLEGLTRKEIAHSMGISYWTVNEYLERVRMKLDARNMREAISRAFIQKYLKEVI